MSYNPEQPFGRCDTAETVQLLENGLAASNIDVLQVENLNVTGRDCVFLAMIHGVRPEPRSNNRRLAADRDNNGAAVDMADVKVENVRDMIADLVTSYFFATYLSLTVSAFCQPASMSSIESVQICKHCNAVFANLMPAARITCAFWYEKCVL
jgi:hypothetical protein